MWCWSINRRRSGLAAPCHNPSPDVTDDEGKDEAPETPSLEDRTEKSGRLVGNRYVRIHHSSDFRRRGGRYVAGEDAPSEGRLGRVYESVRRVLLGPRLDSESDATERLSVVTGLAILGSDNISSSAYATEEAMRILTLAGAA